MAPARRSASWPPRPRCSAIAAVGGGSSVIDEAEAAVVRRIFDLYLDGFEGRRIGSKEIAKHLSARGQRMRGRPWAIQKVHTVLADPGYRGEHYYNVTGARRGTKRPPAEWIPMNVEPIIDAETFERARQRQPARRPAEAHPPASRTA